MAEGGRATTPGRSRARPTLRPGLRVFRRDDSHLQVGIDDDRLVLPDTHGIRRLLQDLARGDGLDTLTPEAGDAWHRLVAAGLVVDHADLRAVHHDPTGAVAAAFAAHGGAARGLLASRAACRVAVDGPPPWHAVAAERLTSAGLRLAADDTSATVTLFVAAGEPARSRCDAFVREDRPHLVVTLLPDRARLGPLVVPGSTACLRCVDAHLAEDDVRRPVVIEQLESPAPPGPCDPVLAHAALALAARDLASWAEGDRPATWSATLTVSADLGRPPTTWTRHPHCGCSWG